MLLAMFLFVCMVVGAAMFGGGTGALIGLGAGLVFALIVGIAMEIEEGYYNDRRKQDDDHYIEGGW